jgi:Ni,Fe-hydrogenase I large subunit
MSSGAFRKKKVYFSQVSNSALRDNSLSLKAKGLYSIIQSYITIENFTLYKNTLIKACKESKTAFENAWKELKVQGYLKQYKIQSSNGTFYYEYELLDEKKQESPEKITRIQTHKTQVVDNPLHGGTGVYNNTDKTNTESNNTDYSLHRLNVDDTYTKANAICADSSFPDYEMINQFYQTYLKTLKCYGYRQKRIKKENEENILFGIGTIYQSGIDFEMWKECVNDYIGNLPKDNDGDIQCFLKASSRYFGVRLDEEA